MLNDSMFALVCLVLGLWGAQELPGPVLPSPLVQQDAARELARPKLAVVVIVDQMRGDQLARLGTRMTGGLDRFAKQGTVFPKAALTWGITQTGPGHASLGSACLPLRHGITANDWYEGEDTGARYCCADKQASIVGAAGVIADADGRSAKNMRVGGAAQLWKAAASAARVVVLGAKDRSAILSGGAGTDCTLWWDSRRGGYVSSTAFATELPAWVRDFNAHWPKRLVEGPFRTGWSACVEADPEAAAAASNTAPDDQAGERGLGQRKLFPYPLPIVWRGSDAALEAGDISKLAGWTMDTPAIDWLTLQLARQALEHRGLGQGPDCDLLILCFSACDSVGHAFGPTSREATDTLLRLDRELESFFGLLDQRLGRGQWMAALGADHGVMELPERDSSKRRWDGRAAATWLKGFRAAMQQEFGVALVLAEDAYGIQLSAERCRAAGLELAGVRQRVAEWVRAHPPAFVSEVFTFERLRAVALGQAPAKSPVEQWMAASFDEHRTADIVLVPHEGVLIAGSTGTTHGTPYAYDRSVALAFLGPMFQARWDPSEASTLDIMPTLLVAASYPLPAAIDGRPRLGSSSSAR